MGQEGEWDRNIRKGELVEMSDEKWVCHYGVSFLGG